MFVKQTSTLALLSTSDRAITLPAKRWTPPVTGQLIVWRDVCLAADTVARTTAPSARGHCPIHNHGRVLRHSGAFYLPGLHQSNRALVLTVAPDFRPRAAFGPACGGPAPSELIAFVCHLQINGQDVQNRQEAVAALSSDECTSIVLLVARPETQVGEPTDGTPSGI